MGKARLVKDDAAGSMISATLPVAAGEPRKLAYTIPEFCDAVGLSRSSVYREIKARRLKVKKVGARSLVLIEEVQAWLKS